jgi:hypothetical protein
MPSRNRILPIALLAAGLAATALPACYHDATKRFSAEQHCPLNAVRLRSLGGGAYRAEGCNQAVTYACFSGGALGSGTCVPEQTPLHTQSTVKTQARPQPPANCVVPSSGATDGCTPPCSPGYVCEGAMCKAVCNPLCSPGYVCAQDRTCQPEVPPAQSGGESQVR